VEADLFYLLAKKPKQGQPLARIAFTTSAGPLAGESFTQVPWDTFTVDVDGSPVSSVINGMYAYSGGIIVPISGYYEVSGAITFSSSSAPPYAPPEIGASPYAAISVYPAGNANGFVNAIESTLYDYASVVSDIVYLNATTDLVTLAGLGDDVSYIWGYQDPLGVVGTFLTYMSAVYVGS
jgi:hypothetical protein